MHIYRYIYIWLYLDIYTYASVCDQLKSAQQPTCARQEADAAGQLERPHHSSLHAMQSTPTDHTRRTLWESFCRVLTLLLLRPVPCRAVSEPSFADTMGYYLIKIWNPR